MILYTGIGRVYDIPFSKETCNYDDRCRIIDDEYYVLSRNRYSKNKFIYIVSDDKFIVDKFVIAEIMEDINRYLIANKNSMYLLPSSLINYNNLILLRGELNRIKKLNLLTGISLNIERVSLKELAIIGKELEKYIINFCLTIELLPLITLFMINAINETCGFEFITVDNCSSEKMPSNLVHLELYENYKNNKQPSDIYKFLVHVLNHSNFSSAKMLDLAESFIEDFKNQSNNQQKMNGNAEFDDSNLPF